MSCWMRMLLPLAVRISVDKALWREDAENIEGFYTSIGERLPAKLWEELETLKKNLE